MAETAGGVSTLLSTDIVDFSHLLETHEMRALEELDFYTGLLKRLAREYHGEILSNTGDTFLIRFDDPGEAVKAAQEVQRGMQRRSVAPEALPMMPRVAVHQGEVAEREGNYYGETLAAVLELRGVTRPGGVSLTGAVARDVPLDDRWIRGDTPRGDTAGGDTPSGGMEWYTLPPDHAARRPGESESRMDAAAERGGAAQGPGGPGGRGGDSPLDEGDPRGGRGGDSPLDEGDPRGDATEAGGPRARSADADRSGAGREETPESSDIKTRLLREMKRRGRRLTLAEAYDALDVRSPAERRALYNLAASGFLARGRGREAYARDDSSGRSDYGGSPRADMRGRSDARADMRGRPRAGDGDSGDRGGVGDRGDYRYDRPGGRGRMDDSLARRRRAAADEAMVPTRRGVGDEREDREIESAWDQVLSRRFSGATAPTRDPVVKSYREQTEKSLEQVRNGFRGHLISYIGVNGMLITIGILTTAMPWLAIPALGWGIGLSSHWAQVRQRRREVRELSKMRNPTREKLRIFRRLTRARNSFQSHLISNGATSVFLFALNMMVSPGFPWFVFPVGGMAIGVLSHLPAFKSKERKLNAEMAQITARTPAPRATAINPDASPVEQAEELQEGILGQMEELGQRSDVLGADFEKLLTSYVEQVRALTQRAEELDDVLDAHSLGQVGRELADLERKRGSTEDRRLQNQYDETIHELEKQKKSIEALMSEREMIALRINSGLNMLKNVRIELVRLKTASGTRDVAAGIEAQSKELLGQLEDLRAAYEELNDTR
mgnify:CR=1 FL=1